MQLEVVNADGCDDVAFTSGVTGTVREYDLIVALTTPQQTQILRGECEREGERERDTKRGDKMPDSVLLNTHIVLQCVDK